MNPLAFDFLPNAEACTLTIRREFAAPRHIVWDCYTKSEWLNQWFAPAPLTAKTKSMDFRDGGHWHYAMVDPEGNHYWGRAEYSNIRPTTYYESLDAFSNEAGEVDATLPRAKWEVSFVDKGAHTVVETTIRYASLHDLETILSMGMEEGMKLTLEKLDTLLARIG